MPPSTTPSPPQITDLTHEEHIKFVASFQGDYDLFYASPGATKYGSQKAWVLKHVVGKFRSNFGDTSSGLLDKIDRYFRNHTSRCQKSDVRLATVAPPKTRTVTWEDAVASERKDEIDAQATLIRAAEGVNSKGDYLQFYRRARQKVIALLTAVEIEQYKKKAKDLTESRKAPPNRAAVYELQPTMGMLLSSLVQSSLGWETGQFGDAVCFLALAYRGEDQQIRTQFSIASNPTILRCESAVPEIINQFGEHLGPALKKLADRYIPCSEAQQPQLVVSIDETTPKALRVILTQHIVSSWLASGSGKTPRTAENIPWKDLESHEGRKSLLAHPADFLVLESFFPASIESFDMLRDFATNFTSHGPPLFESPPPAGAPVLTITPPSPLTSPTPAPTDSLPLISALCDVTDTEHRRSRSPGPPASPLLPPIQPNFAPLPSPLPSTGGPALVPTPPTRALEHPPPTLTLGSEESLVLDVVSGVGVNNVNEISGGNSKATTPHQEKDVERPSKRKKVAKPAPSPRNLRTRTQTAQSTPAVAGSAGNSKRRTGGRAGKSRKKQ